KAALSARDRACADAADDSGHAVAEVGVTARLGAIFFVEDDDGIFEGGRERGEFSVHREITEEFADFVERSDFFEAEGDTFEVAVKDGDAIAMGANADAGVHEARAVPFAEELL